MDYVIETSNLKKSYKGRIVVDKVNLHVIKGEIYGFVGINSLIRLYLFSVKKLVIIALNV